MARATAGTRRTRGGAPAAAPAGRAIVRDFTRGSRTYDVSFDARTAYDFLISVEIGAGDESDLQPEDRAWLRRARKSLPPNVEGTLDECFGHESKGVFHDLTAMIVNRSEVRDAAAVVAALDEVGSRGVARAIVLSNLQDPVPDDVVNRAIEGDAAAVAELEPHIHEYHRRELLRFLGEAESRVDRVREALAAWLPIFQEVEGRVADLQARDIESRAADRASQDPAALIEKVTGGLRWLPDSQVRRVIMAPSYFGRPYNYIYQGGDWRVFAYPIADAVLERADPATPPASVVRLYRALGDSTRMRILKLLSERDWYLTELATQLELSKPTTKHHLALMRAAGLVTVTEEGTLTYYSLRRERLDEAGVELHRFIG